MDATTLLVLSIIFLATFIRSTFGFGEGLTAVPLLALLIPIKVATPLVVLLSVTVALVVLIQDWQKVHLRSAGWLLAPTILGIPLGIALLNSVHQELVKATLAIVIMAFSGYFLLTRKLPEMHSDSRIGLLVCGFIAGILGGAYGLNAPPLVLYGTMRRWSPQHFRATLQGYFLPASAIAMVGYWHTGLWVPTVKHYYLLSLLVAIPAIFLGRVANRRLSGGAFLKFVYAGLLCVGLVLLVEVARNS